MYLVMILYHTCSEIKVKEERYQKAFFEGQRKPGQEELSLSIWLQ